MTTKLKKIAHDLRSKVLPRKQKESASSPFKTTVQRRPFTDHITDEDQVISNFFKPKKVAKKNTVRQHAPLLETCQQTQAMICLASLDSKLAL